MPAAAASSAIVTSQPESCDSGTGFHPLLLQRNGGLLLWLFCVASLFASMHPCRAISILLTLQRDMQHLDMFTFSQNHI